MRTRALLPAALLAAAALGLTGCQAGLLAPTESESATPSASNDVEAPSTEQPEPSASEGEPSEAPSQSPVSPGEAVDFTCEEAFTLQQLYDFDPNFALADDPGIPLPAAFELIADNGGLVCAYSHVTSGALMLIGVGPAGTDYSEGSTYTNDGNIGVEYRQTESYGIAAGSTYFGSEGDAVPILDQVEANISAQ